MRTFSAILLAAGESRRMGPANKLLLPVGGKPLLIRSLAMLACCRFEEIVVVLGHEAELLANLVRPWCERKMPRVSAVLNHDYRNGQMSSVNCGVRSLMRAVDAILVCPADMPLLEPSDIDALLDAYRALDGAAILVPTFGGRRGNPIVMAGAHREEILAHRNLGCKNLIARNPDLVASVEMPNARCLVDLDTPQDYASVATVLDAGSPVQALSGLRPHHDTQEI